MRRLFLNQVFIAAISSCIGVVLAEGSGYANKTGLEVSQSFDFIYGHGVQSVDFKVKSSKDGTGNLLVQNAIAIESYSGSTKVTVTAGKNGSAKTAADFNENAGYATENPDNRHILQLIPSSQAAAHKSSIASNHNLWLDGELRINGHLVLGDFILGHNGSSDHNWWIGSIEGLRYDSLTNSGINVKSTDSDDIYCVNDSENNYQAVVTSGECNSYSPSSGDIKARTLTFLYAESIVSVKFEPTKFSDRAYSEDGTGSALESGSFAYLVESPSYQTQVTITSGINGSCATANDFNTKFGSNIDEQMVHMFQVISRNLSASHTPTVASNQNVWVFGTLTINGAVVSTRFAIGQSGAGTDQNWWVGSVDGRGYNSPTNSGMNVQSIDGSMRFCINQYTNNNQLVVANGVCNATSAVPLSELLRKKPWWKHIWVRIGRAIVIGSEAAWGGISSNAIVVGSSIAAGMAIAGGTILVGAKFFGQEVAQGSEEAATLLITKGENGMNIIEEIVVDGAGVY